MTAMKTPEEKFYNDAEYANLVNMIESLLHRAHFTPSEVREAATLACIHYEMRSARSMHGPLPAEVVRSLECLTAYRQTEK